MVVVDPHGINDGSGKMCAAHSYSNIDENHLSEKRIESLSAILVQQYGVENKRLVKALCALGEGMLMIVCVREFVRVRLGSCVA